VKTARSFGRDLLIGLQPLTVLRRFLWEKRQSLAMQPGKSHHRPETFAVCKIEGDNLVLGDAIEIAIGTKAKTTRPTKFGEPFGIKNTHKMSVRGVIFTHRRHGIGRSKRIFARYNNVAIGRDG
jgi:hypothetical protein